MKSNDQRLLYRKSHGRLGYLTRAIMWHVKRMALRAGKRHIAGGRRQLITFAFDHIGNSINIDGVYEKDALVAFFEWLAAVGVDTREAAAIDIGANIGNHSLYFSDHFATVYSFEPNPRTFKVLCLNAELVHNVVCFGIGLSDRNGTAVMRTPVHNVGGARICNTHDSNAQTVEIRTLDSVLTDVKNVKLIKIDVEGHERQVITGSQELIKRHMPIVLFEQAPSDFKDGQSAVILLLRNLSYRHFAILKKHPRVDRGYRINAMAAPFLRLLLGESVRIEMLDRVAPDFYSFVIALPEWFPNVTN